MIRFVFYLIILGVSALRRKASADFYSVRMSVKVNSQFFAIRNILY